MLGKDKILNISLDQPSELFMNDSEGAKKELRVLQMVWHPDRVGGDKDVFDHLTKLHDAAQEQIAKGIWHEPNVLWLSSEEKPDVYYKAVYKKEHKVETGEIYIGSGFVAYSFANSDSDLYDWATKAVKELKYPKEAALEKESRSYMPSLMKAFSTNHRKFLLVNKLPEMLCVRDVVNHFGGKLPVRHAAWIISRMYNIACYLGLVAKLQHADITLENLFIDPASHRAALLGGWAFATPLGGRIRALPGRSMRAGLGAGVAAHNGTATLIRLTGLELLGGIGTGSNLLMDKSIPKPILLWLRGPGTNDPLEEYNGWMGALEKSFGKRTFTKMELDSKTLYAEKT